nr:NAD(P)-dependent alcohol dehydrogenase [uncultured Lichenicoccus sp.]
MRAWRFDEFRGLDGLHLHDEPMPEPQRGELLLRVRAVSLNYRDIAMPLGRYPVPSEPGHIPISDAAAEVVAVGAGVRSFQPGHRVIGSFHRRWFGGPPDIDWGRSGYGAFEDGWLAEYKAISEESVVRLPDGYSFEQGATLPCAATTAWTALGGPQPIRPGQSVLTLGTGGVSIFAVQLARALGATVFATTSSDGKAARLRALGADHVLDYTQAPDWGQRVRELTGGAGVDYVIETGGAGTIEQSLRAVAAGGIVALIGFLSGEASGLDFTRLFTAGAVTRPIRVGSRADLQDLLRVAMATELQPVIDQVFEFDEAPAAFERLLGGRHVGKIVIRLPG